MVFANPPKIPKQLYGTSVDVVSILCVATTHHVVEGPLYASGVHCHGNDSGYNATQWNGHKCYDVTTFYFVTTFVHIQTVCCRKEKTRTNFCKLVFKCS